MTLRYSLGITWALTIALGFGAHAQFMPLDPGLDWRVIETDHFRVIYHQGLEGMAPEAAKICEEAYQYWIEELQYTPRFKTNVILADTADFAIGAANPFGPDIISGTSQARIFNEWINSANPGFLEDVLYHEYGHVIDIRKVAGVSRVLRTLFGPIILPNFSKPGWFIEGVPIAAELRRTGASRANATRDAMYFRTYLLNDWKGFPTLAQMGTEYSRRLWPSPYMLAHDFGGWTVRFIAEKYGVEKIALVDELNSQSLLNLISLGLLNNFGSVLERALGVSLEKFAEELKTWLREEFITQIERARSEGLTQSKKISRLPYWNNEPAWSPDGSLIAYYHYDPKRVAGIRLMSPNGHSDRAARSIPLELPFFRPPFWAASPAWSPDGSRLVYARLKFYRQRYLYGDIYLYDVKTRREKRLTREARAYNPVFTPDGRAILFAKQNWGEATPELALYDLETPEIRTLHRFAKHELLDSLAVSPDGKQIALTLWKMGGYQDLYTLPLEGGALTALTQDKAGDFDPAWSPDGRHILFSSNRDGIDNLYAYRVSDGTLHRVTNVLTGAFAPDVSPDGREIAFVSYNVDGYEIHTMSYDPASWKPVSLTQETLPAWAGYKNSLKSEKYHAHKLARPLLYLPLPNPTAPGLLAVGLDPLQIHSYSLIAGLELGQDYRQRDPYFSFHYTYSQFTPQIDLSIEKSHLGFHQGVRLTWPVINQLTVQARLALGYDRWEKPNGDTPGTSHTLSAHWDLSYQGGRDLSWFQIEQSVRGELSWQQRSLDEPSLSWSVVDWARARWRLPTEDDHFFIVHYALGVGNGKYKLGGHQGDFALRGWPGDGSIQGRHAIVGSAQYQLTLLSIEQGPGLWSFFLDDLDGALFIEAGATVGRGEELNPSAIKIGVGAELSLRFVLGYSFPFRLRLGIAQGLGLAQSQTYLDIGFDF